MSSSSEQEDLGMQTDSSEEEVHSGDAGIDNEDTDDGGESEAGESEADDTDEEAPTTQSHAIDASETESDEDDDDEIDDDEDIPKAKKVEKPDLRMEKIQQDVMERYKKRQGKQLYIRFPAKLPEDAAEFDKKVKSLSELIVTAHKPRQKHARFCLVDFANTEDRDRTLKKLNKNAAETKLVVSIPRTDSEDFVKNIAAKKLKQIEKKRAKLLLKKENKKALKQKDFTSTIVVLNIPKSASTAQVKELFPDAIDIQTKPAPSKFNGASIATITMPSTADARKNVKRKLTLGGTNLIIRFNNANRKKNKNKLQKKKPQKTELGAQPKKGPLSSPSSVSNGNQQKKNKKKNKANGVKTVEVKAPSEKTQKTVSVEEGSKSPKKHKANGTKAVEGQSPPKKSKLQLVSNVSQKEAKVVAGEGSPQKKTKQALIEKVVESKVPSKKTKQAGNFKGNNKLAQKKGNTAPNKKGAGKKPQQQNKQKKQPLK